MILATKALYDNKNEWTLTKDQSTKLDLECVFEAKDKKGTEDCKKLIKSIELTENPFMTFRGVYVNANFWKAKDGHNPSCKQFITLLQSTDKSVGYYAGFCDKVKKEHKEECEER